MMLSNIYDEYSTQTLKHATRTIYEVLLIAF